MATYSDCCNACPTVLPTQIQGVAGATGADGTDGVDGVNAFTYTVTDAFVVPAKNANVSVTTVDCSWMAVGQVVYIVGAGYFSVVSKNAGGTSCVLTYLDYAVNYHGATPPTINPGAQISPGGTQLPGVYGLARTDYHVGGSQALTITSSRLLLSTVVLPSTRYFMLFGSARVDFSAATFLTSSTVFLKLRKTSGTAADVTYAVREIATGTVALADWTLDVVTIPPVFYNATANDEIQMYGSISALPYNTPTGAVNIVEASIVAIPID